MANRGHRDALRGRCVLLVHEDAFAGRYLADVIADSGAIVVGPVASGTDDVAFLDRDPLPAALVLSDAIPGRDTIAQAAAARLMATLLIRPAGAPARSDRSGRVLTAPFAGFQVVEAVAELLANADAGRPGSLGPHRRGH